MKPTTSTRKKVVIRKLNKELIKGFVDPNTFLRPEGVEVLNREGRLLTIPLKEIKGIFFVRDFEGNPQRSERKVFQSRPRLSGLWIRMTFNDSEILEGLIPNNLLDSDPLGFHVTPPDMYSNNLRIFIPRSALAGLEVLGVISDGSARRASRRLAAAQRLAPGSTEQIGLLFPTSSSETKS